MSGLARALCEEDAPRLTVATQGKNIAAQNLYAKNGFRALRVLLTTSCTHSGMEEADVSRVIDAIYTFYRNKCEKGGAKE